ncbi:hypothetical protein JW859_05610 [bacterium]|nr:hypothetical protein [bacterium]
MAAIESAGRRRGNAARLIAWLILIIWGGFWVFFSVAAGLAEIGDLGPLALVMHLIMPVAIVILLWICWRFEIAGGILLIAAAVFAFYFFNVHRADDYALALTLFVALVMPVVLAGLLILLCGLEARRK